MWGLTECFWQIQWRRDVGDVNSFTTTPVNKKEPSGCKLPGVRFLSMINMPEKVPTRVNTMTPFTNFWTAKNLHESSFSLRATRGTVMYLSCKKYCNLQENLHVPSKRNAQVKNSSGPVAFILCGPCKEHSEKESEQEKQWGEGVRSQSRRNSYNGTF